MSESNLTGYFLQESKIVQYEQMKVLEGVEMWHVKPLFGQFSTEYKKMLTEASKSNTICEIKIGVTVYKGLVIYFDYSSYYYIVKEQYVDKYKF